jgi:hypothetical protein
VVDRLVVATAATAYKGLKSGPLGPLVPWFQRKSLGIRHLRPRDLENGWSLGSVVVPWFYVQKEKEPSADLSTEGPRLRTV